MSSVNKVILIGNAGRDTEVRYLPSGVAVANVSIATSSKRKDKQSGETIEDTQWHRLTFYDRLAEIAAEYITKGKTIYVEGRLKYGKYTDKDGVEKPTCDVIVEQLQLLGGRDQGDGQGNAPRQQGNSGQQQRGNSQGQAQRQQGNGQQRQAPQGQGNGQQRQAPQGRGGFDDMDEDIPF